MKREDFDDAFAPLPRAMADEDSLAAYLSNLRRELSLATSSVAAKQSDAAATITSAYGKITVTNEGELLLQTEKSSARMPYLVILHYLNQDIQKSARALRLAGVESILSGGMVLDQAMSETDEEAPLITAVAGLFSRHTDLAFLLTTAALISLIWAARLRFDKSGVLTARRVRCDLLKVHTTNPRGISFLANDELFRIVYSGPKVTR